MDVLIDGYTVTADPSWGDEPKKICVVCGDKALGYNFNAITCESCKAFFRRNALKKKVFKCRFSGDCEITISTRRYCQKCRLRKCFKMGMLTDLITVRPVEAKDEPQECGSSWPTPVIGKRPSPTSFYESPKKYFGSSVTPFQMPIFPPILPQYQYSPQNTFTHGPPIPRQISTDTPESYHAPTPQINSIDQIDYNLPSVSSSQLCLDQETHCDTKSQISIIRSPDTDPLVPLPKSVLLHLINLCHQGPSESPISGKSPSYSCTCRCMCGANTPTEEDAACSTDDTISSKSEIDQESISDEITKKSTENWASRVVLDDQVINACVDEEKSTQAWDLVPIDRGSVIEFPPDIDAWKLFRLEEILSANEPLAPPKTSGPPISYATSAMAAEMMDFAIRRLLDMFKCVNAFTNLTSFDQIGLFKGAIRELICVRAIMVYDQSAMSYRPVGYPHRYLPLGVLRSNTEVFNPMKYYCDSFRLKWRKCDPVMLCLHMMILFEPSRANVKDIPAIRKQQEFYCELLRCYLRTVCSPMEAEEVFKTLLNKLHTLRKNLNCLAPNIQVEISPRDIEPLLIEILPFS